ncbi:MAG: PAS domain S-box protein [Chloroflexi bacterium]|nr:PAS domain S-box protein [Chloroflexota bacterium]
MHRIRTRLTIALVVLAIGPLLVMGTVLAWQSYSVQYAQVLATQHTVAQLASAQSAVSISRPGNELRMLITVHDLDEMTPDSLNTVLSKVLSNNDAIVELAVLDVQGQEQGRISASHLVTTDDLIDRSNTDEFMIPTNTGEVYYGDVWFDDTINQPFMTIAVPVVDARSGQVTGVVIADTRLKEIWDIVTRIRVSEADSVYIVDQHSHVVAHLDPSIVLGGTSFTVPEQDGIHLGLDGTRTILSSADIQLGDQALTVVVERPVSEALALIMRMMITIVVLFGLALGGAVLLGFVGVRQIIQPIEALASVVRAIRDGDLSQQAQVTSDNEIGLLAQAFNDMTARLRELISSLEQRVLALGQAEAALRESEARYRTLFDNVPVGLYRTTPDGRYLDVNHAFVEILGYPNKQTLLAEDVVDFYADPGQRERWKSLMELEGTVRGLETRSQRHNGDVIWVQESARIVRDDAGNVLQYEGSIEDITERKRIEDERVHLLTRIQRQAQQVQQIIDTVPEGVILLDGDGRVVLTNPVAESDLLVLSGTRIGDTLTRLGDRSLDELLDRPPKGFWHVVTLESPTSRYFEVIAKAVTADGGWVLVIRDVTQERQVERQVRQQERLAAVGQLAGGIAHDFNNLLTTIILYAQMPLRQSDLPQKIKRALETILDQSRRATRLVQQILDFSRRSPIETKPLDLAPFVEEVVGVLQRTIPEDISLSLKIESGEYIVNADPTRIQQVLMNLAFNARDAMPSGGMLRFGLSRVNVSLDKEPLLAEMRPGTWVCLSVSDTGTGISPDALPHIYEPFFTTKGPGKGTGLGLAQVYGIIKQHDGHINVNTELGQGTVFQIYLPAHHASEEPVSILQAISVIPAQEGETILMVEDNDDLLAAGQEMLESLGYQVETAINGRQALQVFQTSDRIDLVVTDLVMPDMGGRELLLELKKIVPDIKALAVTGYAMRQDLKGLLEDGFLDIVHKPFDLDVLAQAVRRVLDEPGNELPG